jgi:hypothetical protein
VRMVPDQRAVQQLASAGLHPALHDGCAVAPRIRTRRVACSMTASTYCRCPRHADNPTGG